MGWYGEMNADFYKADGSVDRRRELDKMFTWERPSQNMSRKVLKSCMRGTTYYAAVRDSLGNVFAVVTLTRGRSSKDDSCLWWHKDMDESMEPYYYDCPRSILSMLTPTNNERALAWRKACEERAATMAKKERPVPQVGDIRMQKRRGGWLITSPHIRATRFCDWLRYPSRVYPKSRGWDGLKVLQTFVEMYGTDEEKKELAAAMASA